MITPYFSRDGITLYTGDALDVLSRLPAASADCVVTSPPYWGLRDYGTGRWTGGDPSCAHRHVAGHGAGGGQPGEAQGICRSCGAIREDGQYGLESTPEEYVDTLRAVFAQLHRILVDTGTVWLNLGDSYSAAPPGRADQPMRSPSKGAALPPLGGVAVTKKRGHTGRVDRKRAPHINGECVADLGG